MSQQTLVLSWTLRALAAHLAHGQDVGHADLYSDAEGTVVVDRYLVQALERGDAHGRPVPPGAATLVRLDLPRIDADRVAEMLIGEDEKAGRVPLARSVAAAMWGPSPSIERAVERVGPARWQHAEEALVLQALAAWARERNGSVEVSQTGTIRLTHGVELRAASAMGLVQGSGAGPSRNAPR
ncbi:MAG: hypothetical protein JWM10_4151 [Myxococcaceae bacterium]|nr:hypothetical protein [Myxococcaceae bacterium]